MATSGHQYATLAHDDDRWHLNQPAPSQSPTLPELAHLSLSDAFADLAGTLFGDEPPAKQKQSVSDVLRSLTGSQRSTQSYELVEEDDYEQAQITPRNPKMLAAVLAAGRPPSPKEDHPVRTASISRHLPLHNPTPDLQSLQGAYLKNVQALEDSAERISLAGSMEEELQRIQLDGRRTESFGKITQPPSGQQARQFSSSNSIIALNATARSGGYSPAGFVTSPVGSMRSQRGFSQRGKRMSKASLPEPEREGRPLESAMVHSPPSHAMQPRQSSESQRSLSQSTTSDRPGTSASNDTYRQAQHLFTDFDGTHFPPNSHADLSSRRVSLAHPPLARDSRVFREAQPDQPMVYYPAPVPVMLNLPKRLSRGNWAQHEKKRSQVMNNITTENRKSAVWLANAEVDAEFEEEKPKRMSQIPSQLRASAFFDTPGTRPTIELQRGSAVFTLDSILDAAAHAPVTAFTDHPIVGHLGNEVYGQEPRHKKKSSEIKHRKQKSSLSNMLAKRKSSESLSVGRVLSDNLGTDVEIPDDDPERAAERSIAPDDDELVHGEKHDSEHEDQDSSTGEEEEEEEEAEHKLGFLGAPTTLLAELQMRKAQQKLRNRTAANAFPTGMHSTLLELDAVAQLQQKSRKQKHVALAWEDQEAIEQANFDDEDVPLGMLFPEKERQNHHNMNRPLGLMEKKELEENEPLSSRRARLRGEDPNLPQPPPEALRPIPLQEEPAPVLKLAGVDEEDENEDEGETLAQRRKRMQEKQNKEPGLANDIASQLGFDPEQIGGSKTPEAAEPDKEETLGQRRKRLQAEAQKHNITLKPKTSLGDLLRANPVRPQNDERKVSAESKISLLMNKRDPSTSLVDHIQAQQPNSKAIPTPPITDRSPPPYFPNQPLLGHGMQMGQHQSQPRQPYMPYTGQNDFSGMHVAQAHPTQAMHNFQMMNGNMGMGINNTGAQQYPYGQNFNMSSMSLGMNNMMYHPSHMGTGMGGMHMPMNVYAPAAPAYDAIGMGPPLNPQQRANIDRWRQGIA